MEPAASECGGGVGDSLFPEANMAVVPDTATQLRLPFFEITGLEVGVTTAEETRRRAVVRIDNRKHVMNQLMGPSRPTDGRCLSCWNDFIDCPGHTGYIETPMFYHPLVANVVAQLMMLVCHSCPLSLVTRQLVRLAMEADALPHAPFQPTIRALERGRTPPRSAMTNTSRLRLLVDFVKHMGSCWRCGRAVPTVDAVGAACELQLHIPGGARWVMPPQYVRYVLATVLTDESLHIAGMDPVHHHPVHLVCCALTVSPPNTRPSDVEHIRAAWERDPCRVARESGQDLGERGPNPEEKKRRIRARCARARRRTDVVFFSRRTNQKNMKTCTTTTSTPEDEEDGDDDDDDDAPPAKRRRRRPPSIRMMDTVGTRKPPTDPFLLENTERVKARLLASSPSSGRSDRYAFTVLSHLNQFSRNNMPPGASLKDASDDVVFAALSPRIDSERRTDRAVVGYVRAGLVALFDDAEDRFPTLFSGEVGGKAGRRVDPANEAAGVRLPLEGHASIGLYTRVCFVRAELATMVLRGPPPSAQRLTAAINNPSRRFGGVLPEEFYSPENRVVPSVTRAFTCLRWHEPGDDAMRLMRALGLHAQAVPQHAQHVHWRHIHHFYGMCRQLCPSGRLVPFLSGLTREDFLRRVRREEEEEEEGDDPAFVGKNCLADLLPLLLRPGGPLDPLLPWARTWAPVDPRRDLRVVTQARARSRMALTLEEVQRLLAATSAADPYDHAMLCLFVHSGVRSRAMTLLRVEDVWDSAAGRVRPTIVFLEKWGARHAFVVDADVGAALAAHVAANRPTHWLFYLRPDRTRQLSTANVRRWLHDVGARSGVSGDFLFPHGLRHTTATLLDEFGNSLEDTSAFIGHKDVATTLRYIEKKPSRLVQRMRLPWASSGGGGAESSSSPPRPQFAPPSGGGGGGRQEDEADASSSCAVSQSEVENLETIRRLIEANARLFDRNRWLTEVYNHVVREELTGCQRVDLAQWQRDHPPPEDREEGESEDEPP